MNTYTLEGLTWGDVAFAASYDFRRVFDGKPDLVLCAPKAYRAFTWETEGRLPWLGRDWRRLKRERRRWMASAPR